MHLTNFREKCLVSSGSLPMLDRNYVVVSMYIEVTGFKNGLYIVTTILVENVSELRTFNLIIRASTFAGIYGGDSGVGRLLFRMSPGGEAVINGC